MPTVIELNELRKAALAYCEINWAKALWWGGNSPREAHYWWIEGRPDLSYWPFPVFSIVDFRGEPGN